MNETDVDERANAILAIMMRECRLPRSARDAYQREATDAIEALIDACRAYYRAIGQQDASIPTRTRRQRLASTA